MKKNHIELGTIIIPEQHQIMNDDPRGFKIVATCSSYSKNEVKSDLMEFLNKGHEFYYYTFKNNSKTIHTVRVLQKI